MRNTLRDRCKAHIRAKYAAMASSRDGRSLLCDEYSNVPIVFRAAAVSPLVRDTWRSVNACRRSRRRSPTKTTAAMTAVTRESKTPAHVARSPSSRPIPPSIAYMWFKLSDSPIAIPDRVCVDRPVCPRSGLVGYGPGREPLCCHRHIRDGASRRRRFTRMCSASRRCAAKRRTFRGARMRGGGTQVLLSTSASTRTTQTCHHHMLFSTGPVLRRLQDPRRVTCRIWSSGAPPVALAAVMLQGTIQECRLWRARLPPCRRRQAQRQS